MNARRILPALLLTLLALPLAARAQGHVDSSKDNTDCRTLPNRTLMADCTAAHYQLRIVQLQHPTSQNDANEILVAVRNMFDPATKIYLIANQDAIVLGSYPQELDRMEAFIHQIDRPHPAYRLTFTLIDSDSGKRVGVQHDSLIAFDGQQAVLKQGSRVPITTGSTSADGTTQQQNTYVDVGMNFNVKLSRVGDSLYLNCKVDQSSMAEATTDPKADPVIRQAVLETATTLQPNKPLSLGSLDLAGSTRHLEIEVLAEPL